MRDPASELEQLSRENEALRLRLEEAEDTLAAIRKGDVDALVVGSDIYTLDSAQAASNRLRQDVLTQMHDVVLAFDANDFLIYMNPAAERQYGVAPSVGLGRSKNEVFARHWGTTDIPADGRKLLREKGAFRDQRVHRGMDGGEVHMDVAVSRLRSARGEENGTLYVMRDISDRVRVQQALALATNNLARRERQFATLLDNLPDIVSRIDREHRYVYVSPSVRRFSGLDPQAFLGRHAGEAGLAAQRGQDWIALISGVFARGLASRMKFAYPSPVLGSRILEARAIPEFDESGSVDTVLSITVDVTEQELANTALQDSQMRLQFILNSARIGDWELDLRSGRAAHSLLHDQCFGYPQGVAEWSLDALLAHVHPDDRATVARQIALSRQTGEDLQLESRVRWSDGSVHWVALHGSQWGQDGGEGPRLVGIVSDITDRKEAERALKAADRMKDEFLATLAHELRNPLAPIRNALQIMRLTEKVEAHEKARDIIDRQLSQMVHLVDDLLDVSRISQGKVELRLQQVDLVDVIHTAIETSRPLIEASQHQLELRLPAASTLMVSGDVTRLSQIVANLLNNAAKYTPNGGQIHLSAERHDRFAVVTVRDSGVGIPAEMLPQVFDMFTQIDRTLARAQGGLGIGLALVKRLIEMHGGSVSAHSEGNNKGCKFVIQLPLSGEAIVSGSTEAEASAAPVQIDPQLRVLVVDDNIDSAETLSQLVSMMGYQTFTVHDGVAAVRAATSFDPHVILMDIGLPLLSGHDAARQIRRLPRGADMRLIALSGWGQLEDLNKSRDAGFDRHFVKPVDVDALMQVLAGVATLDNVWVKS